MHGQLRLAQRMLAQHIAGQRAAGFAIQRQANTSSAQTVN